MSDGVKGGQRPLEVLVVEDNPGDARLIRETLGNCGVPVHLHMALDGVQALDFLKGRAPWGTAPRPDLVFLDLHLPKKDGREVLDEVKDDPALRDIPVFVLTTSSREQDIRRMLRSKADLYLFKPMDAVHFKAYRSYLRKIWRDQALPEGT